MKTAVAVAAGLAVGAGAVLLWLRREMPEWERYDQGRGWDQGYVQAQADSGTDVSSWPVESDNPHFEVGP